MTIAHVGVHWRMDEVPHQIAAQRRWRPLTETPRPLRVACEMFTCMVQVEVVVPVGLGGCDRGLVRHADDLPGPLLPGGGRLRTPVAWRIRCAAHCWAPASWASR